MQVGSRRRRCFVRESLFCSVVAIEEETWRRLACFAFLALPSLSTLALFFFPDFLCTPLLVPIFFSSLYKPFFDHATYSKSACESLAVKQAWKCGKVFLMWI
jgi:hypothetical protein